MSFIFVGLANKKFRITIDKGRARYFAPDNYIGIGKLFARYPGSRISCSSSIDWPQDGGFPKGFNAHAVLDKAHTHAFEVLAVKIPPPATIKGAEQTVKRAAKTYKHGFPLPLKFLRMAKDGGDALVVFFEEDELDTFLAGIRFSARLLTRQPTKTTHKKTRKISR